MLELPGNSEATIRLLKARVRALEEQMQVAVDGAAGEEGQAMPGCTVRVGLQCMQGQHADGRT
jgi:hypothetical protein